VLCGDQCDPRAQQSLLRREDVERGRLTDLLLLDYARQNQILRVDLGISGADSRANALHLARAYGYQSSSISTDQW